ncbi:MAG: glyoxalase [Gammaproteobacteria bacterium]|nr:MAG: glyoxalase [Gammaproteobacteria bacterium]
MNQIESSSCVIPTLRYQNGQAAIEWLCEAFGFEAQLIIPDETGAVAHAQLVYNNGMIMLGAATNNEFHELVQSTFESGGVGSQSVYTVVKDIDEHHRKAVAAGARIVIELRDEAYGGRGYSCVDPEGHVWNFGTYDPWKVENDPLTTTD